MAEAEKVHWLSHLFIIFVIILDNLLIHENLIIYLAFCKVWKSDDNEYIRRK